MADFTAPSFSLGLDLDFEQPALREESHLKQPPELVDIVSSQSIEEDDFENHPPPQTLTSDSPPLPILKRLKRGLSTKSARLKVVDDEIEDISSPDDINTDEQSVLQKRSSCSSSKLPSHGFIPLSTQCSKSKPRERTTQASNVSTSNERSNNKTIFPKLTISPLRKFRLLDSDTDAPSSSEDHFEDSRKVDICNSRKQVSENRKKRKVGSEDLWKDFGGQNIPTPALDDFCEEYFRSVKDKNVEEEEDIYIVEETKGCKNGELLTSLNNNSSVPPSYNYFYHDDPRIKRLVRERLPNFSPLGANSTLQTQAPDNDIDYMCQFEPSTSRRNKATEIDGSWVNPKAGPTSSRKKSQARVGNPLSETPKNAGKRRVRAVGSGSWFTGEDGRKVYVSKNGKELSGRMAYLQYRKESGTGFKKSRKKGGAGASKKKSKH